MALYFKKYKNNNKKSKAYGKTFARAINLRTAEIEELASAMQDNCTVKRSDILAVLSELGPTMKLFMQNSMAVRLPYLGIFRLGMSTKGEEDEKDFSAANITRLRINFYPTSHKVSENGGPVKDVLAGCKLVDFKKYTEEASATNGNEGNEGDGNTNPATDPDEGERP